MGYVFGILILVLISLWTGFVIGVVICTEKEEDVSRETLERKNNVQESDTDNN